MYSDLMIYFRIYGLCMKNLVFLHDTQGLCALKGLPWLGLVMGMNQGLLGVLDGGC